MENKFTSKDNIIDSWLHENGYEEITKQVEREAEELMKYKNIKVTVNGITFDSKKEAGYYNVLKLKQLAKIIDSFEMQVRYDIIVNRHKIGFYKADFVTYKDGKVIDVIDVKSEMTKKLPVYRLKKKLIKALYGFDIVEI